MLTNHLLLNGNLWPVAIMALALVAISLATIGAFLVIALRAISKCQAEDVPATIEALSRIRWPPRRIY